VKQKIASKKAVARSHLLDPLHAFCSPSISSENSRPAFTQIQCEKCNLYFSSSRHLWRQPKYNRNRQTRARDCGKSSFTFCGVRARGTSHQSRRKSGRRGVAFAIVHKKRQKIGNLSFHFRSACGSLSLSLSASAAFQGMSERCSSARPTVTESAMLVANDALCGATAAYRFIEACD
jgi:hypothetical protein